MRGHLEYHWVFSTMGDVMSTMRLILSAVGDTQNCEDIVMHMGDIMNTMRVFSTTWKNLLLFEYPMVLNNPTVLMISPQMYHDIPCSTQITKDGIPMVLNIPHNTHDIPHIYHDIPQGY